MNHTELALHQQRLLMRSADLRHAMGQYVVPLKKPLAVVDQAWWATQWLVRHPEWPVGAVLVLTLLRPKRALVWGTRLWWGWRAIQRSGLLNKL
jgi:hypothetical protein